MSEESWANLRGSENYLISDKGRIKRLAHTVTYKNGTKVRLREMFLATAIGPCDFLTANPTINGKNKSLYIHRVVAEHFLPKEDDSFSRVRHKDGNKRNNDVSNLEWVPRKQPPGRTRARKIYKYALDGSFIEMFGNVTKAVKAEPKASVSTLYILARTQQVASGGFRWSYEKFDQLPETTKRVYTKRAVYQYDKSLKLIGKYKTVAEAELETGVSNVSRAANKILLTSGGYIWSYDKLHEDKVHEQ